MAVCFPCPNVPSKIIGIFAYIPKWRISITSLIKGIKAISGFSIFFDKCDDILNPVNFEIINFSPLIISYFIVEVFHYNQLPISFYQ